MTGKGNARNMWFFDKIKFGKFVHLVGLINKRSFAVYLIHIIMAYRTRMEEFKSLSAECADSAVVCH